jgi:hypothetical protein
MLTRFSFFCRLPFFKKMPIELNVLPSAVVHLAITSGLPSRLAPHLIIATKEGILEQ